MPAQKVIITKNLNNKEINGGNNSLVLVIQNPDSKQDTSNKPMPKPVSEKRQIFGEATQPQEDLPSITQFKLALLSAQKMHIGQERRDNIAENDQVFQFDFSVYP